MMSMQRLDLPEPCVPQTKSVGNVPTLPMKRGFIGVAKNQPMTGRMTSGRFTCGRQPKDRRRDLEERVLVDLHVGDALVERGAARDVHHG